MRLVVPGYQPGDADRLAELLVRRSGQVSPIFILTWNPQLYLWEEEGQDEAIQVTAAGQVWAQDWSVSRKGGISPGDRAVLYRLNRDRGLVASGTFTSEVHPGPHWDGSGREAMHCDVDWDTVLDFRECLPRQDLTAQIPQVKWGHLQSSGTAVPLPAAPALASLWARHTNTVLFRSPMSPATRTPKHSPRAR